MFYGAGSKQPLTGALEEMPGQTIQPGATLQTAGKILTGNISAAAATLKNAVGTIDTYNGAANPNIFFKLPGLAFSPCIFTFDIRITNSLSALATGGSIYVGGAFTFFGAVDSYGRYRFSVSYDQRTRAFTASYSMAEFYKSHTLRYNIYGV